MGHQTDIEITVNGEARRVTAGTTIADLLSGLGLAPERVAVELNLSILPRATWAATRLASGDRIEVVHFVGGGDHRVPRGGTGRRRGAIQAPSRRPHRLTSIAAARAAARQQGP